MTRFNACERLYFENNFKGCIESINNFISKNEKGKTDLNYIFRFAIKGLTHGEKNSKQMLQEVAKLETPPWLSSIYNAAIYFEIGQFQEAINELSGADIHTNNSIHKSIIQCQCFSRMKRFEEAKTAFEEATLELNKFNSQTCVSLKHFETFTTEWVLDYAQALLDYRQYHYSLNVINTLANLQHKPAAIDITKGTSLVGLCKYQEACKAYLKAEERLKDANESKVTQRSLTFINYQIANILMKYGDFGTAKQRFERCIEFNKICKMYDKRRLIIEENIATLAATKKLINLRPSLINSSIDPIKNEPSKHSPLNDKLKYLTQSSRYDHYHRRVLSRPADYYNYKLRENKWGAFLLTCPWETEMLFHLATQAKNRIVEIGRYLGGSTILLSMANPDVQIVSIDIAPPADEHLKIMFDDLGCGNNVKLVSEDANTYAKKANREDLIHDFLFIDGDHTYEGCAKDIETWYPLLSPGGLIIFHDTYSNLPGNGAYEAVMDFSRKNSLNFLIPPAPSPRFWENKHGSLCAAVKPLKKDSHFLELA